MTIAREISSNYNPLSFKVISFETVIPFNNFMNAICTVLCSFNCYAHFLRIKYFELYKVNEYQTVFKFVLSYSFHYLYSLMGKKKKPDYD